MGGTTAAGRWRAARRPRGDAAREPRPRQQLHRPQDRGRQGARRRAAAAVRRLRAGRRGRRDAPATPAASAAATSDPPALHGLDQIRFPRRGRGASRSRCCAGCCSPSSCCSRCSLVYSATQLRVDAGFSKMVPLEHEYMRTFTEYQKTFGGANRVLVALRVKGAGGDIYTPGVHARAEGRDRRRLLHPRRRSGDGDLAVHAQCPLHRGRRGGLRRRQRRAGDFPRHAGRSRDSAPERAQVGQRRATGGERLPRRPDPRRAARGRSGIRAAPELPRGRQAARSGARQVPERPDRRAHHRLREGGRRHHRRRHRRARVLRRRLRHHGRFCCTSTRTR